MINLFNFSEDRSEHTYYSPLDDDPCDSLVQGNEDSTNNRRYTTDREENGHRARARGNVVSWYQSINNSNVALITYHIPS